MSSTDLIYFADRCRETAHAERDRHVKERLMTMALEYDARAAAQRPGVQQLCVKQRLVNRCWGLQSRSRSGGQRT